ncbi:MAG: hypothetical protein P4L99_21745 [Chthoniobacter sp.]|nr:hypothetical protein [Chthoniobacter sp.]
MNFLAAKQPIGHGHAAPSDDFLRTLVGWAEREPDALFAPNDHLGDRDIYNRLALILGPWTSIQHRRAAACEFLRVLAGDESDWDWKAGRDTTAGAESPEQMEAGAFQVSYDSIHLGNDLIIFLDANGIFDAADFQARIKTDPVFDLRYTFRLCRDATRWDGPINRGWVTSQVNRQAVAEFLTALAQP